METRRRKRRCNKRGTDRPRRRLEGAVPPASERDKPTAVMRSLGLVSPSAPKEVIEAMGKRRYVCFLNSAVVDLSTPT